MWTCCSTPARLRRRERRGGQIRRECPGRSRAVRGEGAGLLAETSNERSTHPRSPSRLRDSVGRDGILPRRGPGVGAGRGGGFSGGDGAVTIPYPFSTAKFRVRVGPPPPATTSSWTVTARGRRVVWKKNQSPAPRPRLNGGPAARTANGFLKSPTRLAPSRVQFRRGISSRRRFSATSAVSHRSASPCESSNTLTARSACSDCCRPRASTRRLTSASRSRRAVCVYLP